ncbi:MAG: histidine kinase [Nocardioidaceae bacterium]|nr:histidine kinase [Nocardioidaceae bacterium]
MEPITAALIAGSIGVICGAAVTYLWRFNEKQQTAVPAVDPTVPAGADAVLSVLSSSAVIIDTSDAVVKASAPAYRLGLIQGDRLVSDELMDFVRAVRRDGQVRDREFSFSSRRSTMPLHLVARVAPLSSRLVVVLVDDRTRERRVEAIRRDFVANVSHELKTPIGAMNLLAEAVSEARDDPDAVERFSARMLGESARLTRLVQQIIDLSRLQGDKYIDEPIAINVGQIVSTACDHSATDAEKRNIQLRHETPAGVFVLGDPDQISAAVNNLVENAVTYSPADSRVAVSVKVVEHDVEITVTDQGIGIPSAEQDRIFERFYRVDPARHRSTGGTGLGLSIVKHVAASHGGSVRVWSEPGEGASFTLVLPAYTPPQEQPDESGVDSDASARR